MAARLEHRRAVDPHGASPAAFPSPALLAAFALAWGIVTGGSAAGGLWLRGWQTPESIWLVTGVFALGGVIGFPVGLYGARRLARGRGREAAFAAMLVATAISTLVATVVVATAQYQFCRMNDHTQLFSPHWFVTILFTGLASAYQLGSVGLRFYFPFGFAALICASVWFARRAR